MNFGDMIGQAARGYGSRAAAIQRDQVLTFNEFDERTNAFGRLLLGSGLEPGERVALFLGNRLEWFDAWFGILKAGLVRVGISHRLTPTEISYQLRDSGARAAIVADDLADLFLQSDTSRLETIFVTGSEYEKSLARVSSARLNIDVGLDAPAALIYTSGTTGRPKGAIQTHRNWLAYTSGSLIHVGLQSDDRVLVAGPLTFSGASHVYSALFRGATHYVLRKFDPPDVLAAIVKYRITATTLVPTMIYMLLEELAKSPTDMSSLRTVVYGGGPIAPERLSECLDKFGPIFVQSYGLTEVPGIATYLLKEDHVPGSPRLASVGRQTFGAECAILDRNGNAMDVGEQGEICVRGDHVALGYWNLPEATAESFQEWFRTGDLGYQDDQGFVYLVDRKSDMIVSGGHNVYPREVEDVLLSHPAVAEASVISLPDKKWGEAVMAVVRAAENSSIDAAELAMFCRERLAGFKCPKSYIFSDDPLPKNPNGKVLRRELREKFGSPRDV